MQEEVRNKLINYIEKFGSSISFIAKKADISRETLSRFKNKKQELHTKTLNKILSVIE